MSDAPALTEDAKTEERTERSLIRSASTGTALSLTVIGSIPALFLIKGLDARPFYIGLLSTLCAISPVGMLLGTVLVPRVGKVRLMIIGRFACLVPAAAMILLAALGHRGEGIIWLAILSASLLALINNICATGWWPLLQDNVAEGSMGTFFARMRTRLRTVEIGIPLVMGFILGEKPTMERFLVPFGLGVVALVLGAATLRGLPERLIPAPEVGLLLRLRLAGRSRHVRSYMFFVGLLSLVCSLFGPFWMVLLTSSPGNPFPGLPAGFVVWLGTCAAVGHLIGLKSWARMVDRHGGRPVSSFCLIFCAVLGLAWLLLPAGTVWLYVWSIVFFFIWGVADGGALMGRTWSMLRSVPVVYQSDSFTLVQLAGAAGSAVGALAGGSIFDALTQAAQGGWSIFGMDPRAVFLCVAQMAILAAYFASRRLVGYETQTPTREILRQAWEQIAR